MISLRCDVYFTADKEAYSPHSRLLGEYIDEVGPK
jgi:hypothetical protein